MEKKVPIALAALERGDLTDNALTLGTFMEGETQKFVNFFDSYKECVDIFVYGILISFICKLGMTNS